ncbi:MAG: hypothetical protein JRD89_04000 [Deltaproteobacteria bacterium]|nr:hypothetical protein [Deltaproteobacteria bacterium]
MPDEKRFIVDDITVIVRGEIHEKQVEEIIAEERQRWEGKQYPLAKIEMAADGNEVEIKSYPRSPIKRIRRITGYLAPVDAWNAAKKAELADRQPCNDLSWKDRWGILDGQF